jgi:DNA repair ATPase RecN
MNSNISTDPNNRRLTSSQCLANPQTVQDTMKNIDKCLTEQQVQSIQNVSGALSDFKPRILKYKAIIDDLNATGEQIYGQTAGSEQLSAVEKRNHELETENQRHEGAFRDKCQRFSGRKRKYSVSFSLWSASCFGGLFPGSFTGGYSIFLSSFLIILSAYDGIWS